MLYRDVSKAHGPAGLAGHVFKFLGRDFLDLLVPLYMKVACWAWGPLGSKGGLLQPLWKAKGSPCCKGNGRAI
eukprot:8492305-Alexandrium_andersonii.AAC.1